MKCERHLMGTHNLQCVRESQCKARGEICGCAGCRTMSCCGGLTCGEVSGQGGQQYCVDLVGAMALEGGAAPAAANASVASLSAEQSPTAPLVETSVCVAEGQTCGGPGLQGQRCCNGMKCERHLMGTHNLQCVRESQCKARGEICGCAGCRTMSCCGGLTCGEVSGQGGQQYCVDLVGAMALEGGAAPAAANASVASVSAGQAEISTAPLFP